MTSEITIVVWLVIFVLVTYIVYVAIVINLRLQELIEVETMSYERKYMRRKSRIQ